VRQRFAAYNRASSASSTRRKSKPCSSPRKVKNLDEGKHKFKVRAVDAAGDVDPTPTKDKFKVVD
jgi:hypothetical protein